MTLLSKLKVAMTFPMVDPFDFYVKFDELDSD